MELTRSYLCSVIALPVKQMSELQTTYWAERKSGHFPQRTKFPQDRRALQMLSIEITPSLPLRVHSICGRRTWSLPFLHFLWINILRQQFCPCSFMGQWVGLWVRLAHLRGKTTAKTSLRWMAYLGVTVCHLSCVTGELCLGMGLMFASHKRTVTQAMDCPMLFLVLPDFLIDDTSLSPWEWGWEGH